MLSGVVCVTVPERRSQRPTTDEEIAAALGREIRAARLARHESQAAVACMLGSSQDRVSRVERGEVEATHGEIGRLEDHWSLPRGTLQRRAGLIDDADDLRERIAGYPRFTYEQVRSVLAVFDAFDDDG